MKLTSEVPPDSWVSVSGGVDSLAICHILFRANLLGAIYHYNHNISSQNDEMEKSVRKFHKEVLDSRVPLVIRRNEEKLKTEGDLRRKRLELFNFHSNVNLVTGAHLDDAVESYLLNIFRGKEGFLPIPFESNFSNGNRILHPFLLYKKDFFLDYCLKCDIMKYVVEDESNKKIKGSRRNLIRNEIIPILEREKVGLRTVVRKKILQRLQNLYVLKLKL